MAEKCTYNRCPENVNDPFDTKYCLFHAPIDCKGITLQEFKSQLWERRFARINYNFKGFIFPGKIYFTEGLNAGTKPIEFSEFADFSNAEFHVGSYDSDQSDPNDCANFENAVFKRGVRFLNARFLGNVYFGDIEIYADALFWGTNFQGNCSFLRAIFHGLTYFVMDYYNHGCEFVDCTFEKSVDFAGATFRKSSSFGKARFDGALSMKGCKISRLIFDRALFGINNSFYLVDPEFIEDSIEPRIYFDRVKFAPFFSYFENIKLGDKNSTTYNPQDPIIIMRNCELKDTVFTNNKMSLFSFYKSSFDEARFISSRWDTNNDTILKIPYTRKNIMPEEILFNRIFKNINKPEEKDKLRQIYKLEELDCFDEISTLYRKMKAALDRSKDYQEASWFYFNEMEMKRLAIIEIIQKIPNKLRGQVLARFIQGKPYKWKRLIEKSMSWLNQSLRMIFSRQSIYWAYKTFAGYGEKPLWSFYWLLFLSIIFSTMNLINGIAIDRYADGGGETYRIKLSEGNIDPGDLAAVWLYTISRVIPANYFGTRASDYYAIGNSGSLIAFINAITLVVLLIFIGVGLKRHFRRF